MTSKPISIVAISGSVRPDSHTNKVLDLVIDELKHFKNIKVVVFDPNDMDIPLPGKGSSGEIKAMNKAVSEATGVILATPEYHGSYSSVIKLMIEHLGYPSVLSGKPVALLGVASGAIGAIKALEHLRSVCSHIGAVVLPGVVSVANVHKIFDEDGRCTDPAVEKRIRRLAESLTRYIDNHICPKVTLEEMVREKEDS